MKTRFALKEATDEVHRELDNRLSRLDLSKRDDYRKFLDFHAKVLPALESSLDQGGLSDLVEGWENSRRTTAIERDLAVLGRRMPAAVPVPKLNGTAELLGTAYVVEGSRLGGRVLRKQVGDGLPADFLSDADSCWPKVVAALDRFLYSDALIDEAIGAARRCFALFLNVAREAGI